MSIRHYINIVEAARMTVPATFALHPSLDPANYDITASFGDVARWKVKTYLGDSQIKKGSMGPVGYIWISTVDNTIIPISRGDEHHEGAEMVHKMNAKGGWSVVRSQYVSVYGLGHNYIYYRDDLPKWRNVLAKFLKWGGKDGVLDGQRDFNDLSTSYSHLVKTGTLAAAQSGTLAPLGQAFYDALKTLQDAILAARSDPKPVSLQKAFKAALGLSQFIQGCGLSLTFVEGLEWGVIRAMPKEVRALAKEKDLQGLEEMFFGFDSFKRKVHETIRHLDPKDTWKTPKARAFFGDLALAENLLAHI